MSPLTRMRKSRDHWKQLAVERATINREMRKKDRRQHLRILKLEKVQIQIKSGLQNLKKKLR